MNGQQAFPGCGTPVPPHPAEYSDELRVGHEHVLLFDRREHR